MMNAATKLTPVNSPDFEMFTGQQAVMVLFASPDCSLCRSVNELIEQLAGRGQLKVQAGYTDTSLNPSLATRYGVSTVPVLIGFAGGKESGRLSGTFPAEAILSLQNKILKQIHDD